LNTRAYKHGWFFNRVIGALYQNWKVQEAHRRNDPSGRVYGIRDRHTVIYAILDRQGGLIHVTVAKSSGAPHLDDEAVAAFRRAQPFPNPPAELVNEKGHIEFPMGFNLRLGEPEFFRLR
jgi:TonB family protein